MRTAEQSDNNENSSNETSDNGISPKIYNPTPVHPKANQILSFPVTLASVIIHIPVDGQEFDYFDYFERVNGHKGNESNQNSQRLCVV